MQDSLTTLLITYKYWVIFPLAFFEGPGLSILLGFLISLGYLNVVPTYIVLMFADLIPDSIYYQFGKWTTKHDFFKKHARKVGLSEERVVYLERLWKNHTLKCMFFTKWALGLSTFLLMTAGFAHLPYRRFFSSALLVTLIQYLVLLTIGFYFGKSYLVLKEYIKDAEIIIVAGIVIIVGVYLLFARYMRSRLFTSDAK